MATTRVVRRSERLDARVSKQEKQLIETAAACRGISVTDLLRMSVTDSATRIIREREVMTLSGQSRAIFVEALLNPPKPNAKALAAVRRFQLEVEG